MSFECFHCKGRHNHSSEGRKCWESARESLEKVSPTSLNQIDSTPIGGAAATKSNLVEVVQPKIRTDVKSTPIAKGHRTVQVSNSNKSSSARKVKEEPYRSRPGHNLFVQVGPKIEAWNEASATASGYCDCGHWERFGMANPTAVVLKWNRHVED